AYPGHTFRATVDTAPIFERELATLAGLGWTGKHTLMIHPRYGSYFLLGTLVTTLDIATSQELGYPAPLASPTDHCGSCTRCIDACPTDAIAPEGYSVDGSRCVSYLTIEHRSAIEPTLFAGMGDWLAGCDICQDVCPHNRRRLAGTDPPLADGGPLPIHPRYTPSHHGPTLRLIDILHWTEDDRRRVLIGSALKRIKLDMWHRNALIAAGNALQVNEDRPLRDRVEAMAQDASLHEMVRRTAQDVLAQLE
ncbi:MAG: epoxyqueuosine reductase, partial [Phycisphaerales bacterium JB063]